MSQTAIHGINIVLGAGAIILQILSAAVLLVLFFGPKRSKFLSYIDEHFLHLGFLLALSSWLVLIYSELAKFPPCSLCWWQRVFIFPLALIFGVALWDKDRKVLRYALPLAVLGFLVSVYQNFNYYFGEASGPCDATGVSCYKHYISEFGGYISIPMLALTAFFAMLVLLAVAHFHTKVKDL